jgi:uncharacterized protein YegJ (DUF2314 family)
LVQSRCGIKYHCRGSWKVRFFGYVSNCEAGDFFEITKQRKKLLLYLNSIKVMKVNFLFVNLVIFILWSCGSNKIQKIGQSQIFETTALDIKMEEAQKKAKENFWDFEKAFKSQDSSITFFSIKYPFKQDINSGNEHIWLSLISFENGNYYGIVDNTPEFTKQIIEGQKISINIEKISDWQYLKNDTIYGAYTTKVIRDQLSKKELENFKQSLNGLILPK